MKPRRSRSQRVLTGICLFLLLLGAVESQVLFGYRKKPRGMACTPYAFVVEGGGTATGLTVFRKDGWWANVDPHTTYLMPEVVKQSGKSYVVIPLWILFLASGLAALALWHRHRPPKPGHCAVCAYNLTGNLSGICPECGTKIAHE